MSFEDFQAQANKARAGSEARRADLKTARRKLRNVGRKKDQVLRAVGVDARDGDERLARIEALQRESAQAARAGRAAYAGALRSEWAQLNEFIQFTSPVDNIGRLADDCPILLFPLRLETRFKKVERAGGTIDQLWVRVFPDDIAIDSFESDLSEAEVRDARAYWLARWAAGGDEPGRRGAWRSLASAHGPGRAYWLISGDRYVPLNLPAEPTKAEGEVILAIGTEDAPVDPELGAIVRYWQDVWRAGTDPTRLEAAWATLLAVVDEERAGALVKELRPANIGEPPPAGRTRDDTVVRVEFVLLPPTDVLETKLHGWSQPPTSSILPERFVFLAFQGGALAMPPQLGNLVPPALILGPDPAAEQGEEFRLATREDAEADPSIQEGDLIVAEGMRWMFDFDEAVARGMGFRIDLSPQQARDGFDRVFVVGLKLAADREKGAALLEELFEQHQSSRKGLAILRQGTPTNNTEDDGSGYSWRHDPDDSFDIYFASTSRPDPTDWFEKTDGRWLAEMLGIDPSRLAAVENYYGTDIAEAKAMQRALWPATMGHFMDSMMNPVFGAETIEQTRQFFTRYVTGRGNVPAIRVGRQPYGILPATNYTGMAWFAPSPGVHLPTSVALLTPGSSFLARLYTILMDMDGTWADLVRQVARVGHGGGDSGDAHQILLDIVGLHPDSVEVYKRYANTVKQIHNIYNIAGLAHAALFGYYPTSFLSPAALLARYGYTIDAEHPEPDIFKKSFFDDAWILGGDRIDRVPNSEVEPIGVWTLDDKNYIRWLIDAARESHDRLRLQDGFVDDKPPSALLYLLLYHALDLSYIDTSLKLHLSRGVMTRDQVQMAYVEPDFIHVEENKETESRWKYLYKSDVQITDDPDLMVGQYIPQRIDTLDEAAAFRDVLAGLEQLDSVATARLERLLMEHIDTVSYRYDAWILGYLHLQLALMRGLHIAEEERPPERGVYIGAYGWLEDLRPEDKVLQPVELPDELSQVFNPAGDLVEDTSNAGYILAPSQNHAVTAAVLRNGHLSNDDPEDREELKIKLSSERVRMAMHIIEGIQGGQSLPALLGYQFERGLHDRTDAEVDAFIFDLRNEFPLAAKKLTDTAPGAQDPEYESIDQIEAKNVMDGVAFLQHIEDTGVRTYPFNLSLPEASDAQQTAINQEVIRLIEANDALADLALAESVHQVVLGNYERAAATLDTYSKGNFPPTPEVIKTPRSGRQLTHRVALQFRTGLSHLPADAGVTPRMVAEPAMHDWLSQVMPGTDEIECVVACVDSASNTAQEVAVTMSDIGLAHIDLLYLLTVDSEQAMSALDDRIVHHVVTHHAPRLDRAIEIEYTRTQGPGQFSVFEVTSLIASLRALLLHSKPLTAADAALPNEAVKEQEQTLSLDPNRVQPLIAALAGLRTGALAGYLAGVTAVVDAGDVDNTVAQLDTLLGEIAAVFGDAGRYGLQQAGTGFVYQWQQSMHSQLKAKVEALIARWNARLEEYSILHDEYLSGLGTRSDKELFDILRRAELQVSSTTTMPLPPTPPAYLTLINDTRFEPFGQLLTGTIVPILDVHSLTALIQAIQTMAGQLPPFDLVGIDVGDEMNQVAIMAAELQARAENVSKEMESREVKAADFLAGVTATSDRLAQVELVKSAARAILGDEFVAVPEFTVDATQGTEWQNTLVDSDHSLRYLLADLALDFPLDDWLYGIARVRDKLHHLENVVVHIEGFKDRTLALVPSQFPYRPDDYWLGLRFPEKKTGTEEPYTVDEDKLLFTSVYSEAFDPLRAQCGLLLDEWTEVIPSMDETVGLTFHYDQPNSEPPQALLLVTPSAFTGRWRWQDVVDTLHQTLDMAKKRAVEPDHVDGTVYSRFLPPIVSLVSPLPLTATLNLALNNQVLFAEVADHE